MSHHHTDDLAFGWSKVDRTPQQIVDQWSNRYSTNPHFKIPNVKTISWAEISVGYYMVSFDELAKLAQIDANIYFARDAPPPTGDGEWDPPLDKASAYRFATDIEGLKIVKVLRAAEASSRR